MSDSNSGGTNGPSPVTNRRGTISKAKSFRRPALNLDTTSSSNGTGNTYKFLNGEEYLGPDINHSPPITPRNVPSSINLESEECKIPVFIGNNGAIYNKYYIAIKIIGIPDEKPNQHKESYLQFNSLDPIYNKFPEFMDFDNYYDYEQALIDWKLQVQKNLGVVQLPHAVGRTYSRPKTFNDRFLRKNSEASADDSLSYDNPSSERKLTDSDLKEDGDDSGVSSGTSLNNNNALGEEVKSGGAGASGRDRSGSDTSTGSFEGQLDGTSPVDGSPSSGGLVNFIANGGRSRSNSSTFLEHRIRGNSLSPKQALQRLNDSGDFTKRVLGEDEPRWNLSKDPWDAMLILPEPEPELYNTYEEYEFALRNWSIEVATKTPIIPPHASQFIQMPTNGKDEKDGLSNSTQSAGSPSKNKSIKLEIEALLSQAAASAQDDWTVRSGLLPILSEDDQMMIRIESQSKLALNNYEANRFCDLDESRIPKQPPPMPWRKFDPTLKYEVAECFERLYRKKLQAYKQAALTAPCGYWSHRLAMMHMYRSWRDSLAKKSSFLPLLPTKAARRIDLASETDGGKVETQYPIPEFSIQFSKLSPPSMNVQSILGMFDQTTQQQLNQDGSSGTGTPGNAPGTPFVQGTPGTPTKSQIHSSTPPSLLNTKESLAGTSSRSILDPHEDRKQYLSLLQQYDKRLMYSFRFDQLYSWYDEDLFRAYQAQFDQISHKSSTDMNSVWTLITNNQIPLDKFQEFIDFECKLFITNISNPNQASSATGSTNSPGGRNPLQQSSSNLLNNVTSPVLQHQHSLIGSPPSRSGSTGSFSFGSPISNSTGKLPMSPNHSNSVLANSTSGLDSPRSTSSNSSNQNGGSPRSQITSSSSVNLMNQLASSSSTAVSQTNASTSSTSSTISVSPLLNTQFINSFINNVITTDSFPILLSFLDKTKSQLSIAKTSTLIILALVSESKSNILFETTILGKDLQSLYKMAQAMSYFDVTPFDLFPYPSHLNEMFTFNLMQKGGSLMEVVKLVYMYYYLSIIQDRLPHYLTCNSTGTTQSSSNILNQFPSFKRDTSERIANYLQNDRDLISKIFLAIGKKSKFISHSFLFILIQLLKMDSISVQSQIKQKDTMLPLIKDLSHSKFLHCKFAARRLFTILSEEFRDFTLAEYYDPLDKDNKQPLLSDLLTPDNMDSDGSSLVSELVNTMCTNLLTQFITHPHGSLLASTNGASGSSPNTSATNLLSMTSKPIFKFILNETIFYQFYNHLVKSKKHDQNTENLSKLFALLCKTLYKSNLIRKTDTIRMNQKKKEDNLNDIQITPICLFDILTFLNNPSINEKYSPQIKTNMLIALRHLLKSPELFDVLKKEEKFYNKLIIPNCRDTKNIDFNRNSWRLFYQMIRFHAGHLEFLEKGKYLIQVMDIISLNSGSVVLNHALHYLTKLFSLVVYETKKKSDASRIKHVEKDIKSLVSFFADRHLFIKLHMIYKRFSEHRTFPGFIKLVNLYQVITTLPICSKLAKDTMKNPDYKEGILQVSKLFKFEDKENSTVQK